MQLHKSAKIICFCTLETKIGCKNCLFWKFFELCQSMPKQSKKWLFDLFDIIYFIRLVGNDKTKLPKHQKNLFSGEAHLKRFLNYAKAGLKRTFELIYLIRFVGNDKTKCQSTIKVLFSRDWSLKTFFELCQSMPKQAKIWLLT